MMDIVEELKKDPENGAKRLEAEYKNGLMALAIRFCNDLGDAEELVNSTFAEVVENVDDFLEQSSLFTWMCKILTSKFARSVRRKSVRMEVFPSEFPEAEDEQAHDEIYRHLDASLVRDAIETLPPDIKKTLLLHYFMDMPVKEVARVLSSPTSTITWRLHYARKILAAKLGAVARKPGVKATLLVLALCGLTALGAAALGVFRASEDESPAASATASAEPSELTERSESEIASESDETACPREASPKPVEKIATPDFSSTTSKVSSITQQEPTIMNRAPFLSAAFGAALAAASPVRAATTISIDSVVQRWPWNNKVDITYTVDGGQDLANGSFYKIVFTTVVGGATYTIDGVSDVGASATAGTHTVTWTLPSGVKSDACTMSAAIYPASAPSGDDYMVVDLNTGKVSFEGLLATQSDSNARYNTDEYKTSKLVLRKVPAGGTYPTGDSAHYADANSSTTWTTDRDFYIGVFPVTQSQYSKLCGTNPSYFKTDKTGNLAALRPVETVSWYDLRRQPGSTENVASTAPIPKVDAPSGTFFQRLCYIAGNKYSFDLPTEVMYEISERAGSDATYYWGSTMNTEYVVCSSNNDGSTLPVGSRTPNAWGLYDTCGNAWEWVLDDGGLGNLAHAVDPFTPQWTPGMYRRRRGGGSLYAASSSEQFHASNRQTEPASSSFSSLGFRVALICD